MLDLGNDVGKGTVKLLISNENYACDKAVVTRKLNEGWKTAHLTCNGYSLPCSEADVVEVWYDKEVPETGTPSTDKSYFYIVSNHETTIGYYFDIYDWGNQPWESYSYNNDSPLIFKLTDNANNVYNKNTVNPPETSDFTWDYGNESVQSQEFIAPASCTITKISLRMGREGIIGNVQLFVRAAGSDHMPTGNDLGGGTINGNNLPIFTEGMDLTTLPYADIPISPVTLTSGSTYCIMINAPNATGDSSSGTPNDVITTKKLDGYVTKIVENRRGKELTYEYELYGREAFVNYRLYKPENKTTIASDFITSLVTSIGYPAPVCEDTLSSVTIILDNLRSDYVHNFLRKINDEYTINYYYDTGLTLHAFYNSPSTLGNLVYYGTEREKVTDITDVCNRVSITTDSIYINNSEEEYKTEDANAWTFKRYKTYSMWNNKLYDDPERNAVTSTNRIAGNYSVFFQGETFKAEDNIILQNFEHPIFGMYILCDLGQTYWANTLSYINYGISISCRNAGGAIFGNTVTAAVSTEVFNIRDYPPNDNERVRNKIIMPYKTKSHGMIEMNSNWYDLTTEIPLMSNAYDGSLSLMRYIGIYITVDMPNSLVPWMGGPFSFNVYVDNLHIRTSQTLVYTNDASTLAYGIRDYKPDNNGKVEVYNTTQFTLAAQNMLKPNKEDSLRRLVFPGSVDIEVGTRLTLNFDDFTKVYRVEEVVDTYDNGHWMQELALSSSPIKRPKTAFAEKMRYLDNKVKDLTAIESTFSNANDFAKGIVTSYISAGGGNLGNVDIKNANLNGGTLDSITVLAFSTIGTIESIGYIGQMSCNTINTIQKIGTIGEMSCNTISTIESIGVVGVMAANTITSVATMNVLAAAFNTIGSVGYMNVALMAASTINSVGEIGSIGTVQRCSFGTIGTIRQISSIETASFNQIGNINNITRIGTFSALCIDSVQNIGTIGMANIGRLTNVGEINIDHCYNIGYLDTLASVGTINNVEWLESIGHFGTINTINTVYRIDTLTSCGSIGANVMWIGSASINTMNTGIAVFTSATIGNMNVSGYANFNSATITSMKVTGTININNASIGAILGTISSANFVNANIGTVSNISQLVGLNNNITVASGTTLQVVTAGSIYNMFGSSLNFTNGSINNLLIGTVAASSFDFKNSTINNFILNLGAGNAVNFTGATIGALNVTGLASLSALQVSSATITNVNVTGSLIGSNIINSNNIGTLIIDADNIGVLEVRHFPAVASDNSRASGGKTIQFNEQLSGTYRIKFSVTNLGYNNYSYYIVVYANTTPCATIGDEGYWDGTDFTSYYQYDVSTTIPAAGRVYLDINGGTGVNISNLDVCYDITQYRSYEAL